MKNESLYLTTVAGLQGGAAVVGCHLASEGLDPTRTRFMFLRDGAWGHWFDIEDVVYSIASRPRAATGGKANVSALTRGGRLWEMVSGGQPSDVQLDVAGGYYMLHVSRIENDMFCCGVQDMVFRVHGQTARRIDQGIFQPLSDQVDRALESINGFGVSDVYAAGHSGKIWHWDGNTWRAEPSMTNLDLFAIRCTSAGTVLATGGACTVLRKETTGAWSDLSSQQFPTSSIRGIAEFGGEIYLAAGDKLLTIRKDIVEEIVVRELSDIPGRFYAISSDGDRLWTAGDNALLCFDGTSWSGYTVA